MIVLDASIVGPLAIPDEADDMPDEALLDLLAAPILVPTHWRLEVANMLRSAVRRQRLTLPQRDDALARLSVLPVIVDSVGWDAAWTGTIVLADRHDITPYDAAYLELAQRRQAILATRDKALTKAAHAEGISVTRLA